MERNVIVLQNLQYFALKLQYVHNDCVNIFVYLLSLSLVDWQLVCVVSTWLMLWSMLNL